MVAARAGSIATPPQGCSKKVNGAAKTAVAAATSKMNIPLFPEGI
jgi:hypothetical protein